MAIDTLSADYVSKYVQLLNKLRDDRDAVASLKVSILCSENNLSSRIFGNDSPIIENYCPHCLIPWQNGHFIVKTIQKKKTGNSILKKKIHSTFIMVIKCLVCLNKTSTVFNKNKVLKNKPIKTSNSLTSIKKNEEPLSVKEVNINTKDKKKSKKKRNIFAGLNPLVFKNRDLCKKNSKNLPRAYNKNESIKTNSLS